MRYTRCDSLTSHSEVLDIRLELLHALKNHEFLLHYQPVVDLRNRNVIASVEALVRWQHPQRGLLAPHEFIPLAEESGLIVPIGLWALEESCRACRRWQELTHRVSPTLSVNLSVRQFQQDDVVEQVRRALRETSLEPWVLELEITESAMIRAAAAAETLRELKALGVRLALDDFGAGYSSLSYLHSFPVDALKIDQSLVSSAGAGSGSWTVVEAIIGLAHALGLTTIVEGIETEEQLEQARSAGSDGAQGYYFYEPMPEEALMELLQTDAN